MKFLHRPELQRLLLYAPPVLSSLILLQGVFAPLRWHMLHFSIDDSFYYYSWARNLAHGLGPTVDGNVYTNGVQPLWALMLTGLAFVFPGGNTLVVAALLLSLILLTIAAVVLVRMARDFVGFEFAICVSLIVSMGMLGNRWALLSGMEISLNILLCVVLLDAVVRLQRRGDWTGFWKPWSLGVLLGLFLLGRIDNLLYLMIPGALQVWFWARKRTGMLPPLSSKELGAMAIPVVAMTLPYLLFNRIGFGAWLPSSAEVKWILSQKIWIAQGFDPNPWHRIPEILSGVAVNVGRTYVWSAKDLFLFKDLFSSPALSFFVLPILAIVLAGRGRRRQAALIVGLAVAASIPRQMVYAAELAPPYLEYGVWYLAFEFVFSFLALAWVFHRILVLVTRIRPGWSRRVHVLVLLLVLAPFQVSRARHLHEDVLRGVDANATALRRVAALRWAEEHLSKADVLGSLNAGLLSYLARRPLLCLDGRVDDGSLARILESGGNFDEYLRRRGVTHLVDTDEHSFPVFGECIAEAVSEGRVLARFPDPGGRVSEDVIVIELPASRSGLSR